MSKLESAVLGLLDDVMSRHPEIKSWKDFRCPLMQQIAKILGIGNFDPNAQPNLKNAKEAQAGHVDA